jgi:hypothetical protein
MRDVFDAIGAAQKFRAASSIEAPPSIAALRSSMSISVHSAPNLKDCADMNGDCAMQAQLPA